MGDKNVTNGMGAGIHNSEIGKNFLLVKISSYIMVLYLNNYCSLHRNLIEHLNAEIVLHTITDVSIALEWLRSTFFYVRVKQNPKHYGRYNSV